jgi:hypothetical protein
MHDSGDSLVLRIDGDERAMRMRADPETFYMTEHYVGYPMMLVRLSTVHLDDLEDLIAESWRRCAPKRLVAEYDRAR